MCHQRFRLKQVENVFLIQLQLFLIGEKINPIIVSKKELRLLVYYLLISVNVLH